MTHMGLFFSMAYFSTIHPFGYHIRFKRHWNLAWGELSKVYPAQPPGPGFSSGRPGAL